MCVKPFVRCKRCGRNYYGDLILPTCPQHGMFCNYCRSNESKFPISICPDCNISRKEVRDGINVSYFEVFGGDRVNVDKVKLSGMFFIIKFYNYIYWVGSRDVGEMYKLK